MTTTANVSALATRIGTECKALRTLINNNQGDLTALTTTDKSSLVAALNEVQALVTAGPTINDAGTGTTDIWSASKIATEIGASIDGLVSGAPGTLDTISEIATALQNNPDVIANLLAQQASNTTAITAAQGDATQALTNAAAAATTAGTANTTANAAQAAASANTSAINTLTTNVGDTTTDFVALFDTALV